MFGIGGGGKWRGETGLGVEGTRWGWKDGGSEVAVANDGWGVCEGQWGLAGRSNRGVEMTIRHWSRKIGGWERGGGEGEVMLVLMEPGCICCCVCYSIIRALGRCVRMSGLT